MATIDVDRSSDYNTREYVSQHIRWEEFAAQWTLPDGKVDPNAVQYALDLPSKRYDNCAVGMDIGLTSSPSVISIFGEKKVGGVNRLALIRRFTLERFSSRWQREVIKHIFSWNPFMVGFGMDTTGLGFPIFQELTEEENLPDPSLLNIVASFKFNEKIPVGIDPSQITNGKDPFGRKVDEEKAVVMMTVIEATTRYLREWVDTGYLLLPFDTEITNDLLAENMQRISYVSSLTGGRKPNAFHILDSFRMAALVSKKEQMGGYEPERKPVLDGYADVA